MAQIEISEFQITLDPDKISRIDISTSEDEKTQVDIYSEGEKQATRSFFPDRATALRFYMTLWQLRATMDATIYLLSRTPISGSGHEIKSTAKAMGARRT